MRAAPLISLTGAPGSGKTTVARMLAERFDARLIEEDYAGNPFLAESYEGSGRFRLAAQSWFLLSRVNQLAAGHWPADGVTVTDYAYAQDGIYAGLLLDGEDLAAYRALSSRLADRVVGPGVVVLLDGSVELLRRRIAGRGRRYEKTFTPEFLGELAGRCAASARRVDAPWTLVEVDIDAVDLRRQEHQRRLADRVRAALAKGVTTP